MDDFHARFRQFLFLDRKRSSDGLTPTELRRWMKLKRFLNQEFSPGTSFERADRRESVRVPTRLRVCFGSEGELRDSLMTNLSRGGLFVETPEPADIGTFIELRLQIDETGEALEVSGKVVSQNVGPGFQSGSKGMGIRFLEMKPDAARKIDELYERRLKEAAARRR